MSSKRSGSAARSLIRPKRSVPPAMKASATPQPLGSALGSWLAQRRDLDAYRSRRMPYPVILVSSEGGGIYVASGTTILHDVPDGTLVMSHNPQREKPGWTETWHQRHINHPKAQGQIANGDE